MELRTAVTSKSIWTSSETDLSTDDEINVLNKNTNDLQLRFANSEEIKRDHRLFDERQYQKEYAWLYYNFSKNGYLCKVCEVFYGSSGEKPGGSRGAWSHRAVHFKDNPGKKLTRHDKSDSHGFALKSLTNLKTKETLEKPDESNKEMNEWINSQTISWDVSKNAAYDSSDSCDSILVALNSQLKEK